MTDLEVLAEMPSAALYDLHRAAKRCRALARQYGATETPTLSRLVRATDVELCDRVIAGALTDGEREAIGAIR